jgi:hypothetical protein
MRKYLICYWTERNDECTDIETFVEADNITEALKKFKTNNVFKSIDSISEIINPNYTPNFNYENN